MDSAIVTSSQRNVRLDDYSYIDSGMCRGSICRTTSSRESDISPISPRTSWFTMGWERRRNQHKSSMDNICRLGKNIRYMFSSTSSTQADIHAGDIVYSRLMGKDIIIINSEKIAKELLENRSRNYSDRPYLITNEMSASRFFHPADLNPLFQVRIVFQFRSIALRRSMATSQAVFPSNVSA